MKLKMYTIYDKKSQIYHPPSFAHNDGHAMRQFRQIFRDPQSLQNQFPEDFQVWRCGVWDDATGVIEVCKNPEFVSEVSALVERTEDGK